MIPAGPGNIHKTDRLTLRRRERIARLVECGQTANAVAQAAGICPRTVRKWAGSRPGAGVYLARLVAVHAAGRGRVWCWRVISAINLPSAAGPGANVDLAAPAVHRGWRSCNCRIGSVAAVVMIVQLVTLRVLL